MSHPLSFTESLATTLLDSAECGFALLTREGTLLYSNPAWHSLETDETLLFVALQSLLEEGEARVEQEYRSGDGTAHYLLCASLIPHQGQNCILLQRTDYRTDWEEQRVQAERERQIREVLVLEKICVREISSATAEIYDRMSLRESHSEIYKTLLGQYGAMLQQMAEGNLEQIEYDISDRLRAMADQLGLLHVGASDVIDLHTQALRKLMAEATHEYANALLEEGRWMVLELMHYLVAHYRKYLWLNQNQSDFEDIF